MLHLLEDAHWVERPDEARRLRLLICQVPRSLYDAIEKPLSTPNQDGISDERFARAILGRLLKGDAGRCVTGSCLNAPSHLTATCGRTGKAVGSRTAINS